MCKILFNTSGVVDCIHAITMDVTMDPESFRDGIGRLRRLNLNITISQIKMYIKGSTYSEKSAPALRDVVIPNTQ